MPSYEYICPKCGTMTLKIVPVRNRDTYDKCENCGIEVKRAISMPERVWGPTRNR